VSKSENKVSVGEIVNMVSVDCTRIQDCFYYFHYLPNSGIFVGAAIYVLYSYVGGKPISGPRFTNKPIHTNCSKYSILSYHWLVYLLKRDISL